MANINLAADAFNATQSCELLGVTHKQIVHWDKAGLVKPSIRPAAGRGSRRLYSYADLLALRTVKGLREQGVSLQKVRKCVLYLRRHMPAISQPLNFCVLITDGETVFLIEDRKTLIDTVQRQGQRAFLQLSIAALDSELRRRVLALSVKRVYEVTFGDEAYQVEVEPDAECGGFVAEVAGLPGCLTQGETLEEVLENARDAIGTYLEAAADLRRRGVPFAIPQRRVRRRHTA